MKEIDQGVQLIQHFYRSHQASYSAQLRRRSIILRRPAKVATRKSIRRHDRESNNPSQQQKLEIHLENSSPAKPET